MAMNWLPDGLELKGKSKMAPFGEDSWLSEFKTVEKYGQDIMEKINERNKLRRNGGNYNKVQSDVRIMLKNFSKEVNNLKQSLLKASSRYEIAEREIDRRQNMLDQLITREKQMNSAFQQESGHSDNGRSSLLVADQRRQPSNPFDEPETYVDNNVSIDDMRRQQQQIIREQDEGLEALSGIIQRQKMMGQAISDEVDLHNEIIDDIDVRMDQTNTRLIKETSHVKRVTKKASTCGMLVVIILLIIAIIVVAVIPGH
ncbi:syntaxin-8-like isoform X2 [Acropora palmata]|uniref:syntaxin-8-like isoform X2 n=1 Tax=Acropora palmata TaxID=6131 RepID=UPI003DA0E1CA